MGIYYDENPYLYGFRMNPISDVIKQCKFWNDRHVNVDLSKYCNKPFSLKVYMATYFIKFFLTDLFEADNITSLDNKQLYILNVKVC